MKIKVPEGMLKALLENMGGIGQGEATPEEALEAALRWLSENPIVPNDEQSNALWRIICGWGKTEYPTYAATIVVEWQRRMFLENE
jgi:hypothetical protein